MSGFCSQGWACMAVMPLGLVESRHAITTNTPAVAVSHNARFMDPPGIRW